MAPTPTHLRVDYRRDPLGVHPARLEFSWHPGSSQVAYQVEVRDHTGTVVWDSGRVLGSQPFGVRYEGPSLAARTTHVWRVRIWGSDPGEWSDAARFETDSNSWTARWVTGPGPVSSAEYAALYLRGRGTVSHAVVRARAYVSALGWYHFLVNGVDVTGDAYVPQFTPFDEYVEYQTYDVTDTLRRGSNVFAMVVADGRFRGFNGFMHRQAIYGDRLAGLAQIHVTHADGSEAVFATDATWEAGSGALRSADPKLGERVDLRLNDTTWFDGSSQSAASPVVVLDRGRSLIAEEAPRVQRVGTLTPRAITSLDGNRQVIDFGQNFAGVVRIRLTGEAGTTVTLTHSEVLTPDGELDLDYIHEVPLRRWYQRDEVVLGGQEVWYQPRFSVHGFRYVEVAGAQSLRTGDVEGVVVSADLPVTGSFTCSDDRLTQLYSNAFWSLRSNFQDTPTDCPTRERSGWTGDIQVFAPTATTMVDAHAYLRRYLHQVASEQLPDGRIPVFIPAEQSEFSGGLGRLFRWLGSSVGWGDVSVLLPWTLYRYYGDVTILERMLPTMRKWVDQLAARAREKRGPGRLLVNDIDSYIVDTGFHWGEWLRPGEAFPQSIADSMLRSRSVVATAYLEHSARTLAQICDVLNRADDAARYRRLAQRVRVAWRLRFLRDDGRLGTDRQEDYVRALAFGLVDDGERAAATLRLVELIEQAEGHLTTGFLSTPMLLSTLVAEGREDVAWRLLLQDTPPSWLYQIEQGATTIWETWWGHAPDGRARASHNHYALGSVGRFLVEHVAGLAPSGPGYRELRIAPLVRGPLTSAAASVGTPYGPAAASWRRTDRKVELEVMVPPGCSATIVMLDGSASVGDGPHHLEWSL